MLNFDAVTGKVSYQSFYEVESFLQKKQIDLQFVLETHVHADHLSAAFFWKQKYPRIQIVMSKGVVEVQQRFSDFFGLSKDVSRTGAPFDRLW